MIIALTNMSDLRCTVKVKSDGRTLHKQKIDICLETRSDIRNKTRSKLDEILSSLF